MGELVEMVAGAMIRASDDTILYPAKIARAAIAAINASGTHVVVPVSGVKPRVAEIPTHKYVPHPKWPWFCEKCGYPEHEELMHSQPLTAAKQEDAGS